MYENIKYEVSEGIGYVTINRPKALNALNMDVLTDLYAAFTEIEADETVKAVIVTGEGKAFVAGADIAQMSQLNALEGREMMIMGHKVMNLIEAVENLLSLPLTALLWAADANWLWPAISESLPKKQNLHSQK